jgi:hypothetical protein
MAANNKNLLAKKRRYYLKQRYFSMYKKTCFVIVLTLAGEVQKFRWLIAVKKSFKRKNCHKKVP